MKQGTPSVYSDMDDPTCTLDKYVLEVQANLIVEMDAHYKMVSCKEQGWIEVILDPWKLKSTRDIEEWVSENCKHATHRSGNSMMFESEEDSVWFKLRWL